MERSYPIPTKPEFSILESPGHREYRLGNRRRPSPGISCCIFFSLAIVLYWHSVNSAPGSSLLVALTVISCIFFGSLFGQVLYGEGVVVFVRWQGLTGGLESVVILGPHGIQLETHRGFLTRLPWLTNRRFIASTHLHGVYISEGLRGWNVRFYLVAIKRTALPGSTFEVAYQVSDLKGSFALLVYLARYQNLLPDQSILQHVYQGIHEILLSSPTTNK